MDENSSISKIEPVANERDDYNVYQEFDESGEKTIEYQQHPKPFRIVPLSGLVICFVWFVGLVFTLTRDIVNNIEQD